MDCFTSFNELPRLNGAVVAIGTFDGVHRGHVNVIRRAVQIASEKSVASAIITFINHPQNIVRQGHSPQLLTTAEEKVQLFSKLGPDILIAIPFSEALARLRAEEFITDILKAKMEAISLVFGPSFRFGHDRFNPSQQPELLRKHGIEPVTVPDLADQSGLTISSTAIRKLIAAGQIESANEMLARRYSVDGQVVKGFGRGNKLGYPTANIIPPAEKILPPNGVYLTEAVWENEHHLSVTNVGVKPTFSGEDCTIEVYLPNFSGNLYGKHLQVRFAAFIRSEEKFGGAEELIRQISKDLSVARAKAALIYNSEILW